MSKRVQLRRGTATENNAFTGAVGEVTVDTTNKTLRVHDGSTAGGTRLATLTGGLVPVAQLPNATTSVKGVVVLNNTVTSESTTQALTAAQGKKLNAEKLAISSAFGVGQTNQNVTSSRVANTTYTNSTGKDIFIMVTSGVGNNLTVAGYVNDAVVVSSQTSSSYGGITSITFHVPNGSTYKVTGSFSQWVEYR